VLKVLYMLPYVIELFYRYGTITGSCDSPIRLHSCNAKSERMMPTTSDCSSQCFVIFDNSVLADAAPSAAFASNRLTGNCDDVRGRGCPFRGCGCRNDLDLLGTFPADSWIEPNAELHPVSIPDRRASPCAAHFPSIAELHPVSIPDRRA
jgi:hypothetical protein